MLSHELRTPLTPVLTSVLALEQADNLSDEMRASLQMIRRNVELEARLIDDLLDLTRISKGKVQLSLEEVDAHSLLRNALEICQADIDKKGLALQIDSPRRKFRSKPTRALAADLLEPDQERGEIHPEGGQLQIRTQNLDGQLQVEVSDTGMGIDAETLPKILTPSNRARAASWAASASPRDQQDARGNAQRQVDRGQRRTGPGRHLHGDFPSG